MANNFDLSALALAMACPGNVQLLDDIVIQLKNKHQ